MSGAFKTYHFDCRGSTVAITDASGAITDTFAYDTYGKLTARTGTSDVIFLYNGRDGVITEDTGLYYMRARYYSPDMRRFINADILAGEISNAVTLNRFAYANGNPVSFTDPFGLSAERGGEKSKRNYEAVDVDGDGTIDYYIYMYSFIHTEKSDFPVGGGWVPYYVDVLYEGKVYFYQNVTTDFFSDKKNVPEGFNSKTDLMIGDFTSSSNSELFAYQAHKVNPLCRNEIIKIMLQYDEDFDTPWERTSESLKIEWKGHHKYHIFGDRARDINFDNNEEGKDSAYFDRKFWNAVYNEIKKLVQFKVKRIII